METVSEQPQESDPDILNPEELELYDGDGIEIVDENPDEQSRTEDFINLIATIKGKSPFDVLGFTAQTLKDSPPIDNPDKYQLGQMNLDEYPRSKMEFATYYAAKSATVEAVAEIVADHSTNSLVPFVEKLRECEQAEKKALREINSIRNEMMRATTLLYFYLPESWEYHQKLHAVSVPDKSDDIPAIVGKPEIAQTWTGYVTTDSDEERIRSI